nr:hypothetical protein [Streptomyces sp. 8K308]
MGVLEQQAAVEPRVVQGDARSRDPGVHQVEVAALHDDPARAEAREMGAGEAGHPQPGPVQLGFPLEPAAFEPQHAAGLGELEPQFAGDAGAHQVDHRGLAGPGLGAAEHQGTHHLGAHRALGAPPLAAGRAVRHRVAGAQVHPLADGEGVPQQALGRREFGARQHQCTVPGPAPGRQDGRTPA